jgi:hypothetical protein
MWRSTNTAYPNIVVTQFLTSGLEPEGTPHHARKSSSHSTSSKRADRHNVCSYAPESDRSSYWNQHENHSPDKGIVVEDAGAVQRDLIQQGRPRKLNSLDLAVCSHLESVLQLISF